MERDRDDRNKSQMQQFLENTQYCRGIKDDVYRNKSLFKSLVQETIYLIKENGKDQFLAINNIIFKIENSPHSGGTPDTIISKAIVLIRKMKKAIRGNSANITMDNQTACIIQMAIQTSLFNMTNGDIVIEEILDEEHTVKEDISQVNEEAREIVEESIPQELQGIVRPSGFTPRTPRPSGFTPRTPRPSLQEEESSMIVGESSALVVSRNSVNINISGDMVSINIPTSISGGIQLPPIAQATLASLLNMNLNPEREVDVYIPSENDIFIDGLERLRGEMIDTIRAYIIQMGVNRNNIGGMVSSTIIFAFHIFRFLVRYLWLLNNRYHLIGNACLLSLSIFKLFLSWIGYIVDKLLGSNLGRAFLFLLYLMFAWTCPDCNDFIFQCLWLLGKIPTVGSRAVLNELYTKLYKVVIKFIADKAVITIGAVAAPFIAMCLSVNETVNAARTTIVETVNAAVVSDIAYNMLYIPLTVVEHNLRLVSDTQYSRTHRELMFILAVLSGNVNVLDTRTPMLQLPAPIVANITDINGTDVVVYNRGEHTTPRNITANELLNQYMYNLSMGLGPRGDIADITAAAAAEGFSVSYTYDQIVDTILLANQVSVTRSFSQELLEGYIYSPVIAPSVSEQLNSLLASYANRLSEEVGIPKLIDYIMPTYIGLTQNIQLPASTIGQVSSSETPTELMVVQSSSQAQSITTALGAFSTVLSDLAFGRGMARHVSMWTRFGILRNLFLGDATDYFELFNARVDEIRDIDFLNVTECPTEPTIEEFGGSRKKFTKRRVSQYRSIKKNRRSNKSRSVYKSRKHKKQSFRKSKKSKRRV